VLIGINLLREGLDLPEVSLVAILDADKEGFLAEHTSLIQTIGRCARTSREERSVARPAIVSSNADHRSTSAGRRYRSLFPRCAGTAPNRLDERRGAPQKSFFVRIQNGHQRHFRQIQAFAQQIDSMRHVKFPAPQIAQDFDGTSSVSTSSANSGTSRQSR